MSNKNKTNKIKCKLLDIETGVTGWMVGGSVWWWCEGNGGCDCNRGIDDSFYEKFPGNGHDHCTSSNFIVIDVDISNIAVGYWEYMFNYPMDAKEIKRKFIQEANQDYSFALLKYGIGRKFSKDDE